ncbi:MAG: DUF4333 domain-containing protein [Deltaproteobacteria bacterium]|nr:DUF4333 domain-containing protein [Kofleriaceae bacterium]
MGTTTRYLYIVGAMLVGGCTFEASCGGKKLDVDKGEKLIADKLKEATGLEATVTCPDKVKLAKDVVTECDVKVGTLPGRAKVTQTDDEGNVRWELVEGYVISAKVEELLRGELRKTTGVEVAIDCGERVRVSEPGKTFRCKATPASDVPPAEIEITITDKQGGINSKMVP